MRGGTEIALRPYRVWETIGFPLGMLVGMGIAASAQSEPSGTEQERAVAGLVLLATGLGFGLVGALVAHLLAGREELLTVTGDSLVIDRELLRWPRVRRRRAYAAGRVGNLRAVDHLR